ncbi:hypothetical protein SpiGrapes_1818 [Sphaerochaeta pleomorpha str. Grapes]|uniref:Uncharacterized protein n=1 Tax=Sphaerochaeta pleomorpha (strain ATCC BAA-1885 / DSM 22778 / Grapes) TaxID=158190 RepID=G8QY48_SPHPG|nr:hypothetical protein [Sphaerochaeta pleomorpha]AEV29613.1 hypothetical protein SpiGrapes_1818 [Sphaerochaeta pleomorpha str. Grapes]
MNNLIKRYVSEVVRHLSEKDRKEVSLELESSILDMLPPDYSEADVAEVLNSMGDPGKLADTYRSRTRYLIGPDNFDLYLYVLKLVATVLASVTITISLITMFFNSEPTIASIITSIITNTASALSGAFLWVTITFALIDYFQVKTKNDSWSVKDLPERMATESLEIKKSESIADIIASAVFIAILTGILYRNPEVFAVFINGQKTIPMFQADLIRPYILIMAILMAFSMVRGIAKIQIGQWTAKLLAASTVLDITVTIFLIYVLNRHDLVNPAFIDFIPKEMGSYDRLTTLASIFLVAITLLGAGGTILKVLRNSKKEI